MANTTGIEWAGATCNPFTGCTKCSEGCVNCYAAQLAATRLKHHPNYKDLAFQAVESFGWTGEIRFNSSELEKLDHWRKPRKIFMCSMTDWLHPDIPLGYIIKMFVAMRNSQHTYQLLTKRADRMRPVLEKLIEHGVNMPKHLWLGVTTENQAAADLRIPGLLKCRELAEVLFVSAEPLLSAINFTEWLYDECYYCNGQGSIHRDAIGGMGMAGCNGDCDIEECGYCNGSGVGERNEDGLDLIILGGENGHKARPMHPDWVTDIKDQCERSNTAFFFKGYGQYGTKWQLSDSTPVFRKFKDKQQWIDKGSTWVRSGICIDTKGNNITCGRDFDTASYPVAVMHKVGRKKSGHLINGKVCRELPEVLAK
jgi:protein gp37